MTQSGWIAAALIAGFLLWLAFQGKLQAYYSLLVGGGDKMAPPGPPPTPGALSGPPAGLNFGDVVDPSTYLHAFGF